MHHLARVCLKDSSRTQACCYFKGDGKVAAETRGSSCCSERVSFTHGKQTGMLAAGGLIAVFGVKWGGGG